MPILCYKCRKKLSISSDQLKRAFKDELLAIRTAQENNMLLVTGLDRNQNVLCVFWKWLDLESEVRIKNKLL